MEHFLTLYGLENFVRTSTYKSVWVWLLKTMFTYHFAQNFVRTSPDVRICSTTPVDVWYGKAFEAGLDLGIV